MSLIERIRCFRFSNWFRSKKKRTKISYERSKNAMNFLCKSVFTIWNRKTICKRRFRSTLKQKFVSKNKNERSFQIRLKMKRNLCRSRWKIVSSRRFWSKMKLNFWTIKWKKKTDAVFDFDRKKNEIISYHRKTFAIIDFDRKWNEIFSHFEKWIFAVVDFDRKWNRIHDRANERLTVFE